jgi:hypothetical protein
VPDESDPRAVQIPVASLGVEDVPVLFASAFTSQFDPQTLDSLILTVGQVTPPAVAGATDEEREEQLRSIAYVPIKPVVRLGLTEARARELVATLQANLDQLEVARSLRPADPR